MTVNKTATKTDVGQREGHRNFMAGISFDVKNPLVRLRMIGASCFFGEPQYYHRDKAERKSKISAHPAYLSERHLEELTDYLTRVDPQEWRGKSPAQIMESAIDEALDYSVEDTLRLAVALRNDDHIRVTPQVILVRAANHPKAKGTGLIVRYADQIMKRADEPATAIAYQLQAYGKPIPNSLKKGVAKALASFSTYDLAKYRMESRNIKTVDVVNLVHPQITAAIDGLVKGNLLTTDATWESIISAKGSTKETWTEAIGVMGHMALLRNLRNFIEKGVPYEAYLPKLVKTAAKGQQLPFRYYSAYKAVENKSNGPILDAIEQCLVESLGNLPRFNGKVISLCDNSGSAKGTTTSSLGTMQVASIANLSGVLTGMVSDDGYVGIFGDNLRVVPVRKTASVFDQLKALDRIGDGIGGGTEHGIWLFFDQALKNKEHYDHIFVYSDMQAGHGGLYGRGIDPEFRVRGARMDYVHVPKMIAEYRKRVNPNVMVYLVQVAGYQDTLVPEYYDKTYILGGWSDGILKFAAAMSGLYSTQQG